MLKGSDLTVAGAEQALTRIAAHKAGDYVVPPTRASGLAVGGEAALIQLLNTWRMVFGQLVLQSYATAADEDVQLERLTRRLYGVVAALGCDKALRFDDESDLTEKAQTAALRHLEALQANLSIKASRGQSLEVLCVDHLGKGTPDLLYGPNKNGALGVRPLSHFPDVVDVILSTVLQGAYRRVVPPDSAEAISGMLWEIFRNTEDHGRVTLSGDQLERSFRGIQARKHDLSPASLVDIVGDFAPLRDFVERLRPRPSTHQVHLFELTVFDSGIGFAQSLTQKSLEAMTLAEELSAVQRCFNSGSRKSIKGHGEGLPHVVRLLDRQKGFLRLRTGRLSLYADLGADDVDVNTNGLQLQQWKPAGMQQQVKVSGSVLTILFPLGLTG